MIEGKVTDKNGKARLKIDGQWNKEVVVTDLETKEQTVIWERPPKIDHHEDQYGLTQFAISLNHLTPELEKKIAPTDSRFRPDLRAFENGDIDEGAKEKHRLEEKQREVRKMRNEKGEFWTPLYFEEVIDEDTGDKFFKINDKYWFNREAGDWSEAPDIF